MWKKKFRCANSEDYYVNGNYHTTEANTFNVGFKICEDKEGENECYDKEKIKDWLNDQFILLIYH